jgi:hypothetical protein
MLANILTQSVIDRVESINSKNTPGDRLHAYIKYVQKSYGVDTESKLWSYHKHMAAYNDGMPCLTEILDYLSSIGIERYK